MEFPLIQSLAVGGLVAICASILGAFAILKRMSLVGDALSHVALPGIAMALLLNINPFLGAVVFLVIATIGIWYLEYHSKLPIDTIVGILFSTSLAIGALITPDTELLEVLFGNITSLSREEAVFSMIISLSIVWLVLVIRKKLTLSLISEELAHSAGVKIRKLEFLYLLFFSLAVALGIRFVGALLMGSLVVIPAASAKNIAKSLKGFLLLAAFFGVVSAELGLLAAYRYNLQPGPIFILAATAIFLLSLLFRTYKSR